MFEKFNLIQYSLTHDGKKLTDYILTDITTRARLRASTDILLEFELNEGEMPEDVSQEVYGTPYYHWTIMMVNNVFDVYSEWFMGDAQLYAYCVAKYNVSCTVTPANISVVDNTFTKTGHMLKPNDAVTMTSRVMPGGFAKNTTYYAFNTTDNTFQLTANMHDETPIDITSVGAYNVIITCDKLNLPAYFVDEQGNIMSSALNLYEGWSNNEDTRITYKNKMNEIITTRITSGGVVIPRADRYAYAPATNKSVTVDEDEPDTLNIVETETPAFMVQQPSITTMTNFEYETMLNQKRKKIFIVKPEYIKTFVDQFNTVVQG